MNRWFMFLILSCYEIELKVNVHVRAGIIGEIENFWIAAEVRCFHESSIEDSLDQYTDSGVLFSQARTGISTHPGQRNGNIY